MKLNLNLLEDGANKGNMGTTEYKKSMKLIGCPT